MSLPALPSAARLRRTEALQRILQALAGLLVHTPQGRRLRRAVTWTRDVAYLPGPCGPEHRLDVLRPRAPAPDLPLVIYVHGGGFAFCSKETHWPVAAVLARAGACVVNVNYRRVPQHPFPAALHDVARAIAFACRHARDFGARATGPVLMGESAGANLVLAQALALAADRPPAWAEPLRAAGVRPAALLPGCGLLDVTCPERFVTAQPELSRWVQSRILAVCAGWAAAAADATPHDAHAPSGAPGLFDVTAPGAWASPLRLLEDARVAFGPLPPTFIGVGGHDPIADDSVRLHRALRRRGASSVLKVYPRRGHAFFALPRHVERAEFWDEAAAFVREAVARAGAGA